MKGKSLWGLNDYDAVIIGAGLPAPHSARNSHCRVQVLIIEKEDKFRDRAGASRCIPGASQRRVAGKSTDL